MKKLLCIDGNSILNRSFYGIRLLSTKEGLYTNALYGFTNVLLHQLEALAPDYAAIAYDLKVPTFRHKMYDEYKAGRHAMPPELAEQMPASRELAEALGFHVLDLPGYEADDILGTLSHMANAADEEIMTYVLTGDRDSLQLIGPNVHVLLAGNKETAEMDEAAFEAAYTVHVDQFVDVKALMGDSSDHIPGVAGIGEKTAIKLIAEFGSLDGVYEHLPEAKLTPSVKAKLEAGRENAYLSQTLARICKEAPLDVTLSDLACRPIDQTAARALFIRYEFSNFIKRLGLEEAPKPQKIKAEDAQLLMFDELPMPEAVDNAPAEVVTAPVAVTSTETTDATLASLSGGDYGISFAGNTFSYFNGDSLCHCSITDPTRLQAFLDRADIRVICYDCKQLYKNLAAAGISFRNCFFDVMIAGYVLNSAMGGYDLDRLAMAYLHRPAEVGMEAVEAYRMWQLMDGELQDTKQDGVFYEIEMPLCGVLCDMELYGFRINRAAIRAYGDVLDTVARDMEQRIFTYAGKQFNINSPKQLGDVLFEELMLPTQKKTKTGYSTNAEVLEKLRKYHPIVEDILEYRQVTKLKSTYVDGLLKVADENGRVHTTFKQTGTATGRLSSAEPNLQNIPIRTELGREMRKFFIPSDESKVLIDADYSQIELRLLAHIAGDSAMQNAFRSRKDIHTDTASRVFGVDPEHVTIDLRKKAKAVNFGILYGMGEFSLAEDLHISRAEAKAYIDNYLSSYPNIARYLEEIIATAYRDGYVTTMAGRRRMIPELAESNKMRKKFGERVAMNSPIQGTAADIIKLAMIRVHKRLQGSGLDARMILQVHDELILEADRACADAAEALLKEEMEHVLELSVPLDVEANTGENWFEAH